LGIVSWNFLTNHGRVLLCIARDPTVRMREIAATLVISERRTFGIVTDLTEAGYLIKIKEGRRNRYQIQSHLPLPEQASTAHAIGHVVAILSDKAGTGSVLD
jgi:DNA-binding IclR family transcriptional regulator